MKENLDSVETKTNIVPGMKSAPLQLLLVPAQDVHVT